ncbi:MAG: hypothetical protein QW292_13940 [Candidatus Parvarchaeota archaeon]
MIVAVVIVASAVAIAIYPSLIHTSKSPPPGIVFAFLPTSTLNSTYGTGFNAFNYPSSSNISSILALKGITKVEMVLYSTNGSGRTSAGAIATLIMEMNSSSEVGPAIASVEKNTFHNSTEISSGIIDSFTYSQYDVKSSQLEYENLTTHDFISYSGKFILFMAFDGSTVIKDVQVFKDQVTATLSVYALPRPSVAFWFPNGE